MWDWLIRRITPCRVVDTALDESRRAGAAAARRAAQRHRKLRRIVPPLIAAAEDNHFAERMRLALTAAPEDINEGKEEDHRWWTI